MPSTTDMNKTNKHNNKKFIRAAVCILLLSSTVVTSGCSWLFGNDGYFRSRDNDYMKAEAIPPLEVPEGMAVRPTLELYPIPPVKKDVVNYDEEFEVPRPLPFSSEANEETVKIQKLGERRWIAMNISPSEAWPRIRFFLNHNNIGVDLTDARVGVIETAWLRFQDDPENRNRFRIKIEPGIQPESSEIHIIQNQISVNDEIPADLAWPEVSVDKERENWALDELAKELASDNSGRNSASLLAQTIGGDDKVKITERDQEPILRMEIAANRAKATLQHSLSEGGFHIWEQDDKTGIYYITYVEPGNEPGFFGRLFGAGKIPTTPYTLYELIEHMGLLETQRDQMLFPRAAFQQDVEPLRKAPGILAVVTEVNGVTEVTLRNAYGKRLQPREAREYLAIIRSNLI